MTRAVYVAAVGGTGFPDGPTHRPRTAAVILLPPDATPLLVAALVPHGRPIRPRARRQLPPGPPPRTEHRRALHIPVQSEVTCNGQERTDPRRKPDLWVSAAGRWLSVQDRTLDWRRRESN